MLSTYSGRELRKSFRLEHFSHAMTERHLELSRWYVAIPSWSLWLFDLGFPSRMAWLYGQYVLQFLCGRRWRRHRQYDDDLCQGA
jgi:hypothetical protein